MPGGGANSENEGAFPLEELEGIPSLASPGFAATGKWPLKDLAVAAAKTGGSALASLLFVVLSAKIVASRAGPSGTGLLSFFRQIQQLGIALVTLGGATTFIQRVSNREGRDKEKFVGAALSLFAICAVVSFGVLILLAPALSNWISQGQIQGLTGILRWMVIPIFAGMVYTIASAFLNAEHDISGYSWAQFWLGVGFGVFAIPAVLLLKPIGNLAYVLLLTASSVTGAFVALRRVRRNGDLGLFRLKNWNLDRGSLKGFLSFSSATVIVQVASSFTGVLIRSLILRAFSDQNQGQFQTGLFDASWQVSMMYITLVLLALNAYYLPHLSRTKGPEERSGLISKVSFFIFAIAVPVICSMVCLKPGLIHLLYRSDFSPTLSLLRWMLLGDSIKVLVWVFTTPMLAVEDKRTFLLTELTWDVVLVGFGYLGLLATHNIDSFGKSFLAGYLVLLITNGFYVYRKHRFRPLPGLMLFFVAGFAVIGMASAYNWNAQSVEPFSAIAWIALAGVFSCAGMLGYKRGLICAN